MHIYKKLTTTLITTMLFTLDAMAIEEPAYELIQQYTEFELRLYQPHLVAETTVQGNFKSSGNRAFRILADYIFGNNTKQRKIDMTAPVKQTKSKNSSEKIAMTIPVAQSKKASDENSASYYTVTFSMPSMYTMDSLPIPNNDRVTLKEIPERLVAVHVYSGSWSEKKYKQREKIMIDALQREGYIVKSEPVFARYNQPFTPGFMRRNEIMVEVGKISVPDPG